jgi:hypothetical protein
MLKYSGVKFNSMTEEDIRSFGCLGKWLADIEERVVVDYRRYHEYWSKSTAKLFSAVIALLAFHLMAVTLHSM